MKLVSDNSREAAIIDVIKMITSDVIIYNSGSLDELFTCDIIICNRYESELDNFKGEIFTRDIFGRD